MSIRNALAKKNKEFWFVEKINEYFMENSKKTPTIGRFRPSGISQCMRENLYNYIGVAEYPDFRLEDLKRMERGTAHHQVWEDIFRNAKIKTISGKERKVSCERPRINGTPDWIIVDEQGVEWLIEWKSTPYAYPPSYDHMIQWSIYSWLTGIPRGFLIKEHPISFDLNVFPLKLEAEFVQRLVTNLCLVEENAENSLMIERDARCGRGKPWGRRGCELWEFCSSPEGDSPWELAKEKALCRI